MADSGKRERIAIKATHLWLGETASLQYVSDSDNYVYSFRASGRKLYLRLTSHLHRTQEQIEAELEFVSFLHQSGINVSPPVVSVNGRTVEVTGDENESFSACVFEEAKGEIFIFGSDEANRSHFRLRGRTLGQIHALSQSYTPSENRRRFRWDEDVLFSQMEHYLPRSEKVVWAEYHRLMEYLRSYPRSEESFGLIHGDFGATNLRCRSNLLTVFDFDDCCYHWYVYDLAITIYPHGWREGAEGLLDALLEGYSEEVEWEAHLRDDIIYFCRLRLLYMFLNYAKKWSFSNLSAEQINWLSKKRGNIVQGYVLHE
ncbi:MAG TPA: phosphotransferase [Nitrososphaera sp.]|nr:phosphotransferase [Nitrososphaera sp.]